MPNAKPNPQSTRTKQKQRAAHKLKAAARVLDIAVPLPSEDGQAAIIAYIRSKNGMRLAVDTLFDCLHASRTYYDLYAKKMVTEPDYATRLGAASKLISNEIGEPVKRQQILVGSVETEEQLTQKLRESPALCERVLQIIGGVMQDKRHTLEDSAQKIKKEGD